MKKLITALTIFIILLTLVLPASASSSFDYEDSNANVKFTVPENWHQVEFKTAPQFLKAKFAYDSDETITMMYGSNDMWSDMTASEKKGYSRSDINNEIFSLDDMASMLGVSKSSIYESTYNKSKYYMATITQTKYGITITMTCACKIENGWMYQFQFMGTTESAQFSDFESLLNSVEYPKTSTSTSKSSTSSYTNSTSNNDFDGGSIILGLLISLLITITIYTIPILIYRYGIKKEPLSNKKAKKYTIIYAIIAFFVMTIVSYAIDGSAATGGGLILWSFVNYKILIGGNKKSNPSRKGLARLIDDDNKVKDDKNILRDQDEKFAVENNFEEVESFNLVQEENEEFEEADEKFDATTNIEVFEEEMQESGEPNFEEYETCENAECENHDIDAKKLNIIYCRKCGAKLPEDSKFCNKCGVKVVKI